MNTTIDLPPSAQDFQSSLEDNLQSKSENEQLAICESAMKDAAQCIGEHQLYFDISRNAIILERL